MLVGMLLPTLTVTRAAALRPAAPACHLSGHKSIATTEAQEDRSCSGHAKCAGPGGGSCGAQRVRRNAAARGARAEQPWLQQLPISTSLTLRPRPSPCLGLPCKAHPQTPALRLRTLPALCPGPSHCLCQAAATPQLAPHLPALPPCCLLPTPGGGGPERRHQPGLHALLLLAARQQAGAVVCAGGGPLQGARVPGAVFREEGHRGGEAAARGGRAAWEVRTRTRTHTQMHMHTQKCTRTHTRTHTHAHTKSTHIHAHPHTRTPKPPRCLWVWEAQALKRAAGMCVPQRGQVEELGLEGNQSAPRGSGPRGLPSDSCCHGCQASLRSRRPRRHNTSVKCVPILLCPDRHLFLTGSRKRARRSTRQLPTPLCPDTNPKPPHHHVPNDPLHTLLSSLPQVPAGVRPARAGQQLPPPHHRLHRGL